VFSYAFSAVTLLVGQQEVHLARKNFKTPWDIVLVVNVSGWIQSKVPHGFGEFWPACEDVGEVFLILAI